jgi:hypothetical protein
MKEGLAVAETLVCARQQASQFPLHPYALLQAAGLRAP